MVGYPPRSWRRSQDAQGIKVMSLSRLGSVLSLQAVCPVLIVIVCSVCCEIIQQKMSPLVLVGILVITTSTFADVKHVLEGSAPNSISPQDVNHLASNPPNGQYWWMNSSSPFKAAYDYYKKCNAKGNCLAPINPDAPSPQPFQPQENVKINVKNNPFLNGNFHPSGGNANYNDGNAKIDISKNPFLSGAVVTTGNGVPVVKDENGFLGVQPAQPFKKPGFATTHPLEQTKKPGFATTHPLEQKKPSSGALNITVACQGAGYVCVEKSSCLNGVVNTNGEGLLQVRSDIRYCHEDTEVCCQMNNLNEVTAGKSSVPGSTIKFAGGAGFSPGLIHVQPLDVQPDIVFSGQHGHHSSSVTSKSIRDTSVSPNSVFPSTIDYSNTQFDSDVRFASTFQGPAYLPPVAPSGPTQRPGVEPNYVPSSPSTSKYVPSTTQRPQGFPSSPSVTTRPAPSTSREYLPPRPSTSSPYVPPRQTFTPQQPYQPSVTPQQPYQPSGTTQRPYQPSVTPQKPYQPSVTPQQPYQPSVTPQRPYQPSSTTQRPYQPSVTPQKPYQPSVTPQQPYQPSVTPQQPYQPSVTTQRPYQPSITPQKPYQPFPSSPSPYQPQQTTQRPYQPSVTPQQPYQPSITPQRPFQPSVTPQQPYQPSPSSPSPYQPQQTTQRPQQPYQPGVTPQKPYQPSVTPQQPYQPSVTPQRPYQPSVTPQQPSVTTQRPYQPSVTPQQPYQPSVTPQRPYQPSVTPQQPYQPSVTPQRPYQPSVTPQQPYQPSVTPQRPYQPSVTPQQPYQPSGTTQRPYQPSVTPQQPSVTPQKPYQPSVTPQQPYQPSVTPQRPYQPSVTPQQPYQPSVTPQRPYQPSVTPQQPYQPSGTTQRPYQPSVTPQQPSVTPQRPYQPSVTPQQPYQPSVTPQRPSNGREYLPPRTSTPFVPQPSSPRPNPFTTQPTQRPSTYRPSQPSQPKNGYSFPTPGPSSPRPTSPPLGPSTERYPYPSPAKPSSPPFRPDYSYPTPGPSSPRPTSPPFRPTPPAPRFPSPSSPQPTATNGYPYPSPSSPRPNPFFPQEPVPTSPPYRPTPRPVQPPQPTPGPNPAGGYEYPKPTPTFGYPSTSPRPNLDRSNSDINNQYIPPPTKKRPDNRPENPDQTGDSANDSIIKVSSTPVPKFQGELNTAPPTGCAAALKCVQEIYCTAEGVISPVPVVLTKEQELSRVPTTVCQDIESGIIGKCCRDPNYKDPWPSANLVDGVDDGQYKEDPNLGQYQPDLQRNVRSQTGGPRQDLSVNRNTNNIPDQSTCGERHLRTNPPGPGPLDVNFAEIPWQAMILRDSNRSLLCGGVIIRRDAVLTAAHCVEGLETSDILIKGGEWKLGIDEEPLPFQIVKVAAVVQHPQYQKGSLINDLALLILEEKLRPAKNVGTLCLPQPNQIPAQNCIATGWGKRILQLHAKGAIMHAVDVKIMDTQQCKNTLTSTFQHAASYYSPNTLCGYSDVDQCKVDYGSALACSDGDRYTLSGIYAWDTGCKQPGQIGGYIAPDVDWIETTLARPIRGRQN